jgi:PII-like signaling protein
MSTGGLETNAAPSSSDTRNGEILYVYLDESAKHGQVPLHSWIVREAQKRGLTAAFVFHASEGFALGGVIHTTKIVDLSCNLPIVVVVIDTQETISEFHDSIRDKVKRGLIVSLPMNYEAHS